MKLDRKRSITICIAAEKPEEVFEANRLPLDLGDRDIDIHHGPQRA